ncbi:MAG: symporter [Deltaproteobacteria bacterium]|jgi:BASS family bile acid:Na+ symporter|nr:symporter [Deltaproteobacteria bacterium]
MSARDVFLVLVAFAGMFIGSLLPQWAETLAPFPRLMLMCMLFLGFLAVGTEALRTVMRSRLGMVIRLTAIRLILLPVLCFIAFRFIVPEFALAAFLIGSSPVGVMAGMFSLMVHADTALILVANITTSLLLPLALPIMLFAVSTAVDFLHLGPMNLPAHLSLGGMTVSLCVTILVPFVLANLTRAKLPRLTGIILDCRYPFTIMNIGFTNVAIFSQYGELLHQNPALIPSALTAALALSILMTVAALPTARRMEPRQGLAFVICYGTINNILIMILSMEFFTITEALVAAAYLVPVYMLLLYYRHYARKVGIQDHEPPMRP